MLKFFKRKINKHEAYELGYDLGKNAIDVSVFDELRKKTK